MVVYGQNGKENKADKFYELYSFDKAINAYNKEKQLNSFELRKLAMSYYNRGEFCEAEKTFEKLTNTDSCQKNDFYYYILTLKLNEKYKLANERLDDFNNRFPDDLRARSYEHNKNSFEKLLIPNPNCNITNLLLNSDADDFGTAYFKKQVVFTSSRTEIKPMCRKYNWNSKPFLNMFIAYRLKSNELFDPALWNKKWNKKWHEGPASFSSDGTIVAFTRNNYESKSNDDVVKLQIFFSKMKYGEWTEIEPFKLNNSNYSVGHPCLNNDGSKMYFTSDMPGGFGGSDIYYIEKEPSGEWGKPVNLGDKINTEANEMFPFYDEKNKILYFASNGHSGLGGLDIFSSNFDGVAFSYPENLGSPINSSADDFAFICESTGLDGYFSSNRKSGKGGDDIYSFRFKNKLKSQTTSTPRQYRYRLFVRNKDNGERITDAEVKMGEKMANTNLLGEISILFTDTSTFLSQVKAFGYQNAEKTIHLSIPKNGYEIRDTVSLSMVEENTPIVLREIYYDFDKWEILPESQKELNRVVLFLKSNPDKKIELSSHTDSRGSDKYNIWLSQKRAESATKYIISQGIETERITPKGYGETRLINKCANGVPCTEQEHRANRRTEIYIQGYGKAERIKQTKGKF